MIEIRNIKDTFAEGVDAGWKTVHAGELRRDEILECDVVIVGTGAGGGTAAEILTQAGLDVVLIEEADRSHHQGDEHGKDKEDVEILASIHLLEHHAGDGKDVVGCVGSFRADGGFRQPGGFD